MVITFNSKIIKYKRSQFYFKHLKYIMKLQTKICINSYFLRKAVIYCRKFVKNLRYKKILRNKQFKIALLNMYILSLLFKTKCHKLRFVRCYFQSYFLY